MPMTRKLAPALLIFFILAGNSLPTAQACAIPVFQYALENWPAAPYQVLIYHRSALNGEQQSLLKRLGEGAGQTGTAAANLIITDVDLAGEKDEEYLKIWNKQRGLPLPAMIVCYPEAPPEIRQAWSGAFNKETVQRLLDSPARREAVRRLRGGDAAVWILLESGDAAQDRPALDTLTKVLPQQARTIHLPGAADDDPRQEEACAISFSVVRVSAGEPAESLFAGILRGIIEEDSLPAGKCAAIPVFGRGRALCIIPADKLKADVIEEVCNFVTGACSCQVKAENPGVDLLLRADWEKESKAVADEQPKLPPLVNLGALSDAATTRPGPVKPVSLPANAHGAREDAWRQNLLWAGAGLLALVLGATVVMLRRAHRNEAGQ